MKFKVGDLALTQNSVVPEWNNNLLVVVLAVNPEQSFDGINTPYLIKRVDGQPFGSVGSGLKMEFFKATVAWCQPNQLRKPDEGGLLEDKEVFATPDESDMVMFNAYERAIRALGQRGLDSGKPEIGIGDEDENL